MLIPKFRAIIDRVSSIGFQLYDEDVHKQQIYMDTFKDSDHLFITIEKITKKKMRSLQQNAYYWGVVIDILANETGYTKDEMHEALKVKFLQYENVPGLPTMRSSTDLSTVEFETYMEMIRRWASQDLGIVIPEPNQTQFT